MVYIIIAFTKESIVEKTRSSENLPQPLFAKEGDSSLLPAAPALARRVKGGKEGFGFWCLNLWTD